MCAVCIQSDDVRQWRGPFSNLSLNGAAWFCDKMRIGNDRRFENVNENQIVSR